MTRFWCSLLLVLVTMTVSAVETEVFSDASGTWFRVSLTAEELQSISPADITAVSASPDTNRVVTSPSRGTPEVAPLKRKACQANMKVLASAIEMYNMDHKDLLREITPKTIAVLEQEKYLRAPFRSPSPNCRYSNTDKHGYYIRVTCSVHGDLEQTWEEHRRREDEQRKSLDTKPGLVVLGQLTSKSPARLKLTNRRTGKSLRDLQIDTAQATPGTEEIKTQWLETWAMDLMLMAGRTPGNPGFKFIMLQEAARMLGTSPAADSPDRRNRLQQADLYSLTTGALAIQEALQLDRMTNPRAHRSDDRHEISKLVGPQIKSHPFAEMIGKRVPQVLPIDALVPAHFYACHFSSIGRQMEFGDLLDQWGTSLLHTMQVAAHDAQIKEKFQDQLCLKPSELTRLFGDQVIADLTICGADPFLHEGTDLTVIFNLKNATLFEANAQKNFAEARSRVPGCREETIDLDGVQVHSLTSIDTKLYSLSCTLDNFKVYSNSRTALKTVISTFRGKTPSLAASDDYRYMRLVFPPNTSKEDVFLYLSDAHIRQLVGPVWKITRQRRIQCLASLRLIHDAATLFQLDGKPGIPTLERLVKDNLLPETLLWCPDHGTYTYGGKPEDDPVCSIHGRMRHLTPIIEYSPKLVSVEEKQDYENFVREYNQYWRQFFDPIGIRGTLATDGILLETCILPLVENSIYDGFKLLSGGEPVEID
ncbi:MAG TPA: hypothetical protein PKO06_13705, partial [Candidatus Ozemobacteraceae bacterium]|nr:hypothetical protein [Candidatus Ozemobacteraceae bacterium]